MTFLACPAAEAAGCLRTGPRHCRSKTLSVIHSARAQQDERGGAVFLRKGSVSDRLCALQPPVARPVPGTAIALSDAYPHIRLCDG